MNTHPQIFKLKEIFDKEKDPFRKAHRLIDLFESILKTYTAIIMAEYFSRNNYSNPVKKLLAEGLRTPSLGTWQLFSRVLIKELIEQNHSFFIKSLPEDFKALDKSIQQKRTNIIALRNEYAHGATPDNQSCLEDIKQFEPFLESTLNALWLMETDIKEKEGIVYLTNNSLTNHMTLHPIVIFKPEKEGQPFCFFNDLKNYKMGILNYPLSKQYRDKQLYDDLQRHLPLEEWKKTEDSTFKRELSYLTESFKGRLNERKLFKKFIMERSKGFLTITGSPGIGKSALIAQVINESKSNPDFKQCCFFEYFIQKGTIYADPAYMLNNLVKQVAKHRANEPLINQATHSTQALYEIFLKQISENDTKRKYVFFIDGLDEGAETGILSYLPKECFGNVLFILGSRKGGYSAVEEYLNDLPATEHYKVELKGLNDADIRSLLYDVTNKYDIEAKWVEIIRIQSEGNPLYLKLLCQAIQEGELHVNESESLYRKTDDFYKAIVQRYAKQKEGEIILNALFVFAAAKDYLTFDHIGEINGLEIGQKHKIASVIMEVLNENPMNGEVLEYHIFHETFRSFLFKHYRIEIKKATNRLIQFCSKWNEYTGLWEQKYALEHYASHLFEAEGNHNSDTLQSLAADANYKHTQTQTLHHYQATNKLLGYAIENAMDNGFTDSVIDNAFHILALNSSEKAVSNEIFQMIADNKIDQALNRISSLSERDKPEITEIFSIYILALLELTHLNKNCGLWKKEASTIIIEHFLNNPCFNRKDIECQGSQVSGYLVFLIAEELGKMDLDYTILFRKLIQINSAERWDWISEITELTEFNITVIPKAIQCETHCPTFNEAKDILAIKLFSNGWHKEAIETVKTIKDPEKQIYGFINLAFETGLKKYDPMQHLLVDKAVNIIDDLFSPDKNADIDEYLLVKVSEKLGDNCMFSEAYKILSSYKGDHRADYFEDLCIKFIENGEFDLASKAIREIWDFQNNESVQNYLSYIATGLAQIGDFPKAESLAKKIHDEYKRDETVEGLIIESLKSIGLNNNIYALIEYLSEYKQDEIYGSIIETLCELDLGHHIENIKFSRNFLDNNSYDEILEIGIKKFIELTKPQRAFELFCKMDPGYILEWNNSELFSALLNKNYLDEAKKCISLGKDVFEKSKMLAYLSTAYYTKGERNKSKQIWDEIEGLMDETDFLDPKLIFQFISFFSISSIELKKQELFEDSQEAIDGAIDLFYETINIQVDCWVFEDTLNNFVEALIYHNKNNILDDIIDKSRSGQISLFDLWMLFETLVFKQLYLNAYHLFSANTDILLSNGIEAIKAETKYLSTEVLISSLVKLKEIDKVKNFLNLIKDEDLIAMAIGCCLDNKFINYALILVEIFDCSEDRLSFLKEITLSLFEGGEYSKVLELVSGKKVFEEDYLIHLADDFINVGEYKYALKVLAYVKINQFRKKDLLNKIISTKLIKGNLLDEIASHYFETIKGLPDQEILERQFCESIAVLFANQLDLNMTQIYLSRINDGYFKTRTLQKITLELTKKSTLYEASSLLMENLADSHNHNTFTFDDKYFESLSISLAQKGHIDLSVNTIDLIKIQRNKVNCLMNLLGVLLDRKKLEEAPFVMGKTITETKKITTGYEKESILTSLAGLAIENNLFEYLPNIIECLCSIGMDSEKNLEMYDLLIEKNRSDLALMLISGLFICNNSTGTFSITNNLVEYKKRLKLLISNNHLQHIKDCLSESDILQQLNEEFAIYPKKYPAKKNSVEFTAMLYYALLSLGLKEQSGKMVKSIEAIDNEAERTEMLAIITKVLMLMGYNSQSQAFIDNNIKFANSCENLFDKVSNIISIFRICGTKAITDEAIAILNKALSVSEPNPETLFLREDEVAVLATLSTAFFYARQNKKSDKIIELIRQRPLSHLFDTKRLFNELFAQEKYLQALEIAKSMNNRGSMVKSFCKLGRYEEALPVFKNLNKDSFDYEELSKYLIFSLLKDKLYDNALNVAKEFKNKELYHFTVKHIAIQQVKEKKFIKAYEFTELLKGNDDALLSLINDSAESKEFSFSMYAYNLINNKTSFINGNLVGSRFDTFRKLFIGLLESDSKELLVQFLLKQKDWESHIRIVDSYFSKISANEAYNKTIEYSGIIPNADLKEKFLKSVWLVLFNKRCYAECNDILSLFPDLPGNDSYIQGCIAIVWIKLGLFNEAIDYVLNNMQIVNDQFVASNLLEQLASEIYKKEGLKTTLSWLNRLKHEPEKTYFLKAIVQAINPVKATKEEVCSLMHKIKHDSSMINHLMLSHVLHQIFFSNISEQEMSKYRTIYDLDWAIQIRENSAKKNKLDKSAVNVGSWIHKIHDAQDKSDILIWAERVKKGEMTNEKFMNRVNSLFS